MHTLRVCAHAHFLPSYPQTIKPQLSELDSLRQRNAMLSVAKDELQSQMEHYVQKFAEFQDTLTRSNEVRCFNLQGDRLW